MSTLAAFANPHTYRISFCLFWAHMRRSYFAATPTLVCCLFPHTQALCWFFPVCFQKRSHSISPKSPTGGRCCGVLMSLCPARSAVRGQGTVCDSVRYREKKKGYKEKVRCDDRSARYRIVFDASRKRPVCSSHVAGAPRDGVAFSS